MDEIAEPAAKRRNGCQETGSVSLINYVGVFCSYKYQHELLHRLIGIRRRSDTREYQSNDEKLEILLL